MDRVLRTRQNKPKSLPIWAYQSNSRNFQALTILNIYDNERNRPIHTHHCRVSQSASNDRPLICAQLDETKQECITYILNEVQKSSCNGFEDDEIYSIAVHYYDEDDLEVGNAIPCNVVVNHTIVLTDEEKAEARQQAFAQYQAEELRKLQDRKRNKPKNEASAEEVPQLTLFD